MKLTTAMVFLATALLTHTSNAVAENKQSYKFPPAIVAEMEIQPAKFVEVKGYKMHYSEVGIGDPILLIHGNPTSSYLWRNVVPHIAQQGRVIAVDLIGMGYSDKPNIDYTYGEHFEYLVGFIEALELKNITIVGHDWGAALAWDYARQNEEDIKAIAFMEGVLPPIFPQPSFEAMGEEMGGMFKAIKTPNKGEQMIISDHMFVENILPQMMARNIGKVAHDAYRLPYINVSNRKPLLAWPRAIPINGEPTESVNLMKNIAHFMANTEKPALLLYAEPGVLIPPKLIPHYQATIKNLQTSYVGRGLHFIQEDQPDAIGRGLSDWLVRIAP
jgi:haloalkane dehalogenase